MEMQFEAGTDAIIIDGKRTNFHARTEGGKTVVWFKALDRPVQYITMPVNRYDLTGGKYAKRPNHEAFKADFLAATKGFEG